MKIYKRILLDALRELSDREYQEKVWLNTGAKPIMTISFIEAANNVFDDALITDVLEQGEIVYDKKVTKALEELSFAVDAVNEFRPEEEIISDPKMQVVREKAARALELILASDGKESTVEIVD